MAVIIPSTWSSTVTYSSGNQVIRNGVLYEASTAITAGTDPETSNDWSVVAVHEITNYNSLIEAIRLQINTDDDEIDRSIPLFIQLAEQSFNTRLRVPAMRQRRVLETDSESRIEVPQDLLQVISLRENVDNTQGGTTIPNDIRQRGIIEITAAQDYEDFQKLKLYSNYVGYFNSNLVGYDSPVYWHDNRYFNIAPDYDEGTEMELWYYKSIPFLGTTVFLTDADGNPIDANGDRTSVSGLDQATRVQTSNFWISFAPQMLLYGALCKSEGYLNDPEKMEMWKKAFAEAQVETQDAIDRFEQSRAHSIYFEGAYASNI